MNLEIVHLINEYNSVNKKVDYSFYQKFFEIVKRTYDLDGYLNELIFIPREKHMDPKYEKYTKGFAGIFGQAAYEKATGNLIVYDRNIEFNKFNEMRMEDINDCENQIVLFNLMVLQSLLHEVEHAKQHKLKDSGTDIESELIRVTDTDKTDTVESYEYSLTERLAEIKSIKIILDMYESLGLDNLVVYNFFEKKYANEVKRGYHFEDENGYVSEEETTNLVSPTIKYTHLKDGNIARLNELEQAIDGDDRIIYGLPISIEEYKKLCNLSSGIKL